ncbi:MAG TPA: helix-turn-helix domain-containing protein [Microthrixaceae bacterium]|jgi:predicted ArsR family transcriptional regulator|nr:helix-turn-helix domain-containing protein [Microthrixaceae bacterium]
MTTLQEQARALGDPTRHAIFEYLVDHDRPVRVAELAEHFEVHPNAVRQHLAKLVDAELASEATAAPVGRGRPPLEYSVRPSSESRWGTLGPYERLAQLLTEVVATGDTPEEVGRRAGLREGAAIMGSSVTGRAALPARAGSSTKRTPLEVFTVEIERQGFEPSLTCHDEHFDVLLGACPFTSAVLTDRDTVCQMHVGLATGVAESIGGITIDEFVIRDPRRGRCHIRGEAEDPNNSV